MKKKLLKNRFVVLFLFVFVTQAGIANAAKEPEVTENWAEIFAAEIAKSKSNLGPQCLYESDAQYKAAKKNLSQDEDLQISNADFLADLQKNGIGAAYYNISQYYETLPVCYMTQNEYLALRMYTGSFYTQINSALRQLNLSELKK